MSASFVPDHKAPMVLFLDRVYGIDNQDFLLHMLEVGFLPDMRAAASLDTVCISECHLLLNLFSCCVVFLIDRVCLCRPPGCVQYHRDGSSSEPLSLLGRSPSHH